VTFNWSGKRRWIALILLIAGIVITITTPPVIPVIQLPGEVYPEGWNFFGLPMTNTLMASIIVWIVLILLALYVNSRKPKTSNEVPGGGFYNFFEMAFEGLYNFVANIAGERHLRYIFSFFMTIFLIVLLSNWIELIPGIDSIGFLHPEAEVTDTGEIEYEEGYELNPIMAGVYALDPKCPWLSPEEAATLTAEEQLARKNAGCETGSGAPVAELEAGEHEAEAAEGEEAAAGEAGDETATEVFAGAGEPVAEGTETTLDEQAGTEGEAVEGGAGDVGAPEGSSANETVEGDAENVAEPTEHETGHVEVDAGSPAVPWHIIPFLRAPSTDLNMTAALALIAVIMTQVLGFRALGAGYLTKFFNFRTLFTSPLGGIDVAVGLLELIGEFARILSFAFRLLGNVFAGSILLFVMSFLLPFLPWPFFILEFFVGIIQALVFALLTAIFMNLATQSHHAEDHDHDGHEDEIPVEATNVGEIAEAHA
jgi:F-type H+-transporting ATPase subunit a